VIPMYVTTGTRHSPSLTVKEAFPGCWSTELLASYALRTRAGWESRLPQSFDATVFYEGKAVSVSLHGVGGKG
jgi:hypothetical protein